ncbi:hypothetical protein DM75_2861 [Burkholderia mallei]|nr:hypothetical protein DM75_2861 [Burkholderia mallei]
MRIDHVLDDLVRRVETERRQVADVQLDDAMPLVLEALRVLEDGAADVVADIEQLVRLLNRFHGGHVPG